jgi:UrcA family protein
MQHSTRTVSFALGVAAALLVSGFAQATDVRRLEVSYGDLDLAKPEHATALYWRIQHAAHNVCEINTTPASRALLLERKCVERAVDEAIQSVDNPNLTAIYQAKTGKRAMVASSR